MDRVSFTVPGEPKGKGRPRITTRGSKPRSYTPAATRSYEALVAHEAALAMKGHPPFTGACTVSVVAYLCIPASWPGPKRGKADLGYIHPTKKPDADNILKCLDAINGIVWLDDRQATDARIIKRYSDRPRLEVSVVHLEAAERGVVIVPTEEAA